MALLIRIMLFAIGVALINKVVKEGIHPRMNAIKKGHEPKGQIIEIDDYEVVDEKNSASRGYKVIIQ
jgi:hypothetical protein